MIVRDAFPKDAQSINEIWQRCHKGIRGIPARKFVVTDAIVENGKVVAYGLLRNFAEALIYIDKDVSKFQQAKSFKLLMEWAIDKSRDYQLDNINVGVNDQHFEGILREKYQFEDRGKTLILDLDNGKPEAK